MTVTLDPSCPITPLMPYLLDYNQTAVQEWSQAEAGTFGSALPVGIALTVGSALLLLAGERLTKVALFLCGALVFFVVSLFASNAVLSVVSASPTGGCVTLIAVPVTFGVLGGLLMLKLLTLAFSCVGFAAGAAVGQAVYLLALQHVSSGVTVLSHDMIYFICILALAIPGAILMATYKEALMIIATAALGAVGLVPGLAILVLSRIDTRFLWVTDLSDAQRHSGSPFVYGQALAMLLYFPLGVAVQRRVKKPPKPATEQVQPYLTFQDGPRHGHGHGYGSSYA